MRRRNNRPQEREPASVIAVRKELRPLIQASRQTVARTALDLVASLEQMPAVEGHPRAIPRSTGYGPYERIRQTAMDSTGQGLSRLSEYEPVDVRKYPIPGYDNLFATAADIQYTGKSYYSLTSNHHTRLSLKSRDKKTARLWLWHPDVEKERGEAQVGFTVGISSDGSVERPQPKAYLEDPYPDHPITSNDRRFTEPEACREFLAIDYSSRLAIASLVTVGTNMIYFMYHDRPELASLHADWQSLGVELPYNPNVPVWAQHAENSKLTTYISQ